MPGHVIAFALLAVAPWLARAQQPALGARAVQIIARQGRRFKDLDHNGKVEPYEDRRRAPDERARDLIGRLMREGKAGLAMHGTHAPSVRTTLSDRIWTHY